MSTRSTRRKRWSLISKQPRDPMPNRNKEISTRPFIMIDGHNLNLEKGTGVATYARNLSYSLKSLSYETGILYGRKVPQSGSELVQEIMFFDQMPLSQPLKKFRHALEFFTDVTGVSATQVPLSGNVIHDTSRGTMPAFDSLWNAPELYQHAHRHFRLWKSPLKVRTKRLPDLMHWTYPLPIRMPGLPNIYTLHDLVPLRLPYTTLDIKRRYLSMVKQIANQADHLVTVSETSKRDIINLLGVPEDRITNTFQAVSIPAAYQFKPLDILRAELQGSFRVTYKEYFIYFGAIEPKKNVGRLIEAYLASNVDSPLLLVGAKAWKSEGELKLLASLEEVAKKRVRVVDYVSYPMLVNLIRGAKATLFPSLYEGFGLPVLESMALGTPVLTSAVGSLAEVAGDAALLVDPYSTQSIAEGIRALDVDGELRASMSERGEKRAAYFSQERYNRSIQDVYQNTLSKAG